MGPGRYRRPDLVLVPEKSGPECTGSSGPEEFCTWPRSDFLWSGSDFLWSGSIFDLDQKNAIWARINLVRVTRTRPGPGRLEIWPGDQFFLAQRENSWSRRPDFGGPGPEVHHLAQRLLKRNSIWPRAAFPLVGGGSEGLPSVVSS